MNKFDVFIIGTGTAGQTAAPMLVEAGLSVAAADEREYGGTCALRGCQPKKYLVVPAHAALEGKGLTSRGFTAAPDLDWSPRSVYLP
jgi:glutathione reductase (NADPH)